MAKKHEKTEPCKVEEIDETHPMYSHGMRFRGTCNVCSVILLGKDRKDAKDLIEEHLRRHYDA